MAKVCLGSVKRRFLKSRFSLKTGNEASQTTSVLKDEPRTGEEECISYCCHVSCGGINWLFLVDRDNAYLQVSDSVVWLQLSAFKN
jgi:hypothetical protein